MRAGERMANKVILAIDAILIVGVLAALALYVGYTQAFAIAPLEDESMNRSALLFSIPRGEYVILDDNLDFDSPQTIFLNNEVDLERGNYYIKSTSGDAREIRAETDITLRFENMDDGLIGVFNVGDEVLQVETFRVGTLVNSSKAYRSRE